VVAVRQSIERLRNTGSVLYIAAHPDDENTAFLAYCAQGRHLRTGYLSITRGEGGQNLIGSEQGATLGLIRTQELLAARRIDGAEQFFTRAIDFGFSKSPEETTQIWGREAVLSDMVWVIRNFRPDVIVTRFSGTPRDGHGHHQASALLAREAFLFAADPSKFPQQLQSAPVWQAKRLLWNGFSFTRQQEQELDKQAGRLAVDPGEFDPVLGYSYGELAGHSRSQHKSQGFGAPERRGAMPNFLFVTAGEPAQKDFLEGIDTSWNRVPGGDAVESSLEKAFESLTLEDVDAALPHLLKTRPLVAAINHPIARAKLADLDEAIVLATNLWLDVSAAAPEAVPGGQAALTLTAVNRSQAQVRLLAATLEGANGPSNFPIEPSNLDYNRPFVSKLSASVAADHAVSQPFWLAALPQRALYSVANQRDIGPADDRSALTAVIRLSIGTQELELRRPVIHRYVDRVRGELTRPFVIVPPVSVETPEAPLLFPTADPRRVEIQMRSAAAATGSLKLNVPDGWKVEPASQEFSLAEPGIASTLAFTVTPPDRNASGELLAVATVAGRDWSLTRVTVDYEHIPVQTFFRPASAHLIRENVAVTSRAVGYVMGAGDQVPEALRSLGCEVVFLHADDLARADLSRFDAIVTGVRAWNTRPDLRANHKRLWDYAAQGGAVVVQYNVLEGGFLAGDPNALKNVGPYPIRISRDRITVENSPVKLLQPAHRLLTSPNVISDADFAGWVQERGLYFPDEWDSRYQTILEMADPGEKSLPSAVLYAPVGKGAYVLTSLSFFRQLPAGVPGAYRLFANLLSAAK
jgi:LmbE family N-acetylglucosaminyl deacetylase